MSTRLLPDFSSIVDQLGIDDVDRLRSYIKPGMYASLESSQEEYPLGKSRFGGLPDLPAGMDWPVCEAGPIPFLAQVNLAELPSTAGRELLPEHGMLSFFYGNPDGEVHFPTDEDGVTGGAVVLFTEDLNHLQRLNVPEDYDEEFIIRKNSQLLQFHGCNTFVDAEHPVWSRYGQFFGPKIPALETPWGEKRAKFQILGHPRPMQTSVSRYVADESLSKDEAQKEAFVEWSLGLETLFQAIDADGDCSVYFLMPRADLLARRWDQFRWTLQCT
jgi:hypothetical protein